RAATDIEEVGRLYSAEVLSGVGHYVQCGHHQPGAVADDANGTVQLDVVEVLGLGGLLQGVGRRLVLPRLVVGVAEAGVAVQRDLGVEAEHSPIHGTGERVHLDEGRVLRDERLPQLDGDVDDLVGDLCGEGGL